ncbi:MAG: sulfotransferase [Acidimicrobiales bacterium]|nr:sulfotransferase [Acidimicrobiales bacterium]
MTTWLASYPKSGNTWFRAVITALRSPGAVDLDGMEGQSLASSRATFDSVLGVPSSLLTFDEAEALRPAVENSSELDGPTLRKIHDALVPMPSGALVVGTRTDGAVYLVRDPRDVAVSYAHHRGDDLEQVVEGLCSGSTAAEHQDRLHPQLRQRLASWSGHVQSWVDDAPFPVHVVRYEDCQSDPLRAFGPALAFAGIEASEVDLADALRRASFEELRSSESTHGFRERLVDAPFFRRGEVGAWHDELPAELARRIEVTQAVVMARFGYET